MFFAFANLIHVTFSFLFRFKVDICVSQLKLIIKGDLVAAKQFGSQYTESSEECEDSDTSEECEDSDMGKQRWTSLQFAEVTDLLNKFLRLKSEMCEHCGANRCKLEKPMFGWVRKVCPLGYSSIKFCCFVVNVCIVCFYSIDSFNNDACSVV